MRSDFLGNCSEFPGLPEAINEGQYLVPRMSREERRAAINGPVKVSGAEINPVLLTRLVNDVGDNPDQLSILQHALNRTWAFWQFEGRATAPSHYHTTNRSVPWRMRWTGMQKRPSENSHRARKENLREGVQSPNRQGDGRTWYSPPRQPWRTLSHDRLQSE